VEVILFGWFVGETGMWGAPDFQIRIVESSVVGGGVVL